MGDIFIYKGIGQEKGELSALAFRADLEANSQADVIKIHFHTPGGDVFEGFNMYNTLLNFKEKTGKKVVGIVESLCASIGTLVLGACDEIVMNTASQLMIHNPHVETKGDANKLRGVADHLDKIKHVLIDVWKKRTKLPEEKLWALYDSETWLNASEAKQMGFADDVQDAIKAVAKINLTQLEMEKFNKLAEAFKNLLGIAKIKNEFTETLSDNRVIVVMSEDEEWVGKQVFLETGEPLEDGSHALMSGKTITVAGGIITEVAAATPEDKPNEEMENKIKELESQLAAAKAEQQAAVEAKASLEKEVATAKAETTKIQNRVTDIEKKFLELQEEMSKTVGQKPVIKPGPVIKNVNKTPESDPMGDFAYNYYKNRHIIKEENED
jgi:ATP-dependent protease ClpP protease subunit/uncharacterized coiled-coil protein SlyX